MTASSPVEDKARAWESDDLTTHLRSRLRVVRGSRSAWRSSALSVAGAAALAGGVGIAFMGRETRPRWARWDREIIRYGLAITEGAEPDDLTFSQPLRCAFCRVLMHVSHGELRLEEDADVRNVRYR